MWAAKLRRISMHRNLLVTNFFFNRQFLYLDTYWTTCTFIYPCIVQAIMQIHLAQWIISFASLHFDVLTQVFQCELLCFRHVKTSIDDWSSWLLKAQSLQYYSSRECTYPIVEKFDMLPQSHSAYGTLLS